MSKTEDRLQDLGKAYIPRASKNQTAAEFVKEELEKNGISQDAFKKSEFFTSGDFAKLGEVENRISQEMGGPQVNDDDDSLQAASTASSEDGQMDKVADGKAKKGKQDDEEEEKSDETVGKGNGMAGLSASSEKQKSSKSEEGKDEEDTSEGEKTKKVDVTLSATSTSTSTSLEGDDPSASPAGTKTPEDDLLKNKVEKVGEFMSPLIDLSPTEKLETEKFLGKIRVYGNDVKGLIAEPFPDATKPRHHGINFFAKQFVPPIRNVTPVPVKLVNKEEGYGASLNSSDAQEISDPDVDCYNLLTNGSAGLDPRLVASYYARLDGNNIARLRQNGILRIDMDYSMMATGKSINTITNQAAVVSGSMYANQGTAVMTEERAIRINVGLYQFMKSLATPESMIKNYGNSSNAFKMVGTADAVFLEDEVQFYGCEMPGFPIEVDMSFCIVRGWNTPIGIPDFHLTTWIAKDEELGKELRDRSMAAAVSAVSAFEPSEATPLDQSYSKNIFKGLLTAVSNLTAVTAARFATTVAQFHVGGAFRQLSLEVHVDEYTKQLAPYACVATAIMTYFPMYELASQITMVDAMLRPFCGAPNPRIRNALMGNVNNPVEFVDACMEQISVDASAIAINVARTRPVLQRLYTLLRQIIHPVLNSNSRVDGRFYTFQQNREPRLSNGILPQGPMPPDQLYGTRVAQKGLPVGGEYFKRDMEAITWCNLQAYQADVSMYNGYSVMVSEESYTRTFHPFASKFMAYLTLVNSMMTKKEQSNLDLFKNYGTDMVREKGGGLMNMSLGVMYGCHDDDTLMAGPGYQGVTSYLVNPNQGTRSNYGEIPIDFYGALSFMRFGCQPVDIQKVNKFHALERLTVGNVGSLREKNMQMAIMIANDVMAACCNPTIIPELSDPQLQRNFANGMYNYYYLENYEDEVIKTVESICRLYYKAGGETEKFAVKWVTNRKKNCQPGSPFEPLYFDNVRFHDNGYTRLSLINMRDVYDVRVSSVMLQARRGYGFTMPTDDMGAKYRAEISRKQMPFTVLDSRAGLPKASAVQANAIMANDIEIRVGAATITPTTVNGLRTSMGVTFNRKNRFMLLTRDNLMPRQIYGVRQWSIPVQHAHLVSTSKLWTPFDEGVPALTNTIPESFKVRNFVDAGTCMTVISKAAYQSFTAKDSPVRFDPTDYALWMTNSNILCDVSEDQLLAYMRGGLDLHHLPSEKALTDQGIEPILAEELCSYPNTAYLLSDLYTLANLSLRSEGGLSAEVRGVPQRNSFSNMYGQGLIKYALRKVRDRLRRQITVGDIGNNQFRNAYIDLGGDVTGNAFSTVIDYYAANPALLTMLMTAVIRGSSFSEKAAVMVKVDVEVDHKEISDTTTFERVKGPVTSVVSKEYFAGLITQRTGGIDGVLDAAGNVNHNPAIPLAALKVVTEGKVTVPYTNTDRAHVVNVESHALSINPNVDAKGKYIPPSMRSRREQAIVAVIGSQPDIDFGDYAGRVNILPDSVANATNAGRDGSEIILAPSPFPLPNASRIVPGSLPPVHSYTGQNPVRCLNLYDYENEFEWLMRIYAIPVIAPKSVKILPFKFETTGVHTTMFEL